MKKNLLLLLFCLLAVGSLQAQFAKPLKNRNSIYYNTNPFSIGITGGYAVNDMIYSAVHKSQLLPVLAPSFGLVMEWNTFKRLSVGLDASYAMRGTHEAFSTEFLTSYSTTTFARVNYTMNMNGIEVRLPITLYLGHNEMIKPYIYLAPRFHLWLNGKVNWERTYDDESFAPLVYESDLNQDVISSYDMSAIAGLGLCTRLMMGHTQMFIKFDVSYGYGPFNMFSKHEIEESVEFQGWGDIAHETLGQRKIQNLEARLTFLLPLRNHLKDACAFEQKMRNPK